MRNKSGNNQRKEKVKNVEEKEKVRDTRKKRLRQRLFACGELELIQM